MKIFRPQILFLFLLFSTTVAYSQNFKVSGTTTGVEDGTWLYLRIANPEKTLDSTKVIGGKFSLSGTSAEKATKVIVYTAKYKNYVSFWAEQNTVLELKEGSFKQAKITGSKTQTENNRLAEMRLPLEKKDDSLSKIWQAEKDPLVKKELQEKVKAARDESQQVEIDYVKNNPNSLVAAYILDVYSATWGKEKTTELYANLNPSLKKTTYGQNIGNYIRLNRTIKIGEKFADFEQLSSNGKKIKLSDIKGKYILLDFWASWCGPCREENPSLVVTYNAFKDKGFAILGVSADDNKINWLKAIADDQLPWANVSDLKGDRNEAAVMYGINAYPTSYLIDDKGIIIAKNLRGEALKKKLEELMP